jgi:PAS domain S-box-containing protein
MATAINILIIEDSQDDAELVLRELRRSGFDPKWKRVETEPDFLAEIKKSPDIILSDYSMPQFNGLRAVELLRKSGLDIPFILISGTVGEDVAVEAMQYGATDYLLKDRLARLGQAVERALRESKEQAELKLAEKELQTTHAQLRQLLEHSPAVIYSLKVEGQNIIPKVVSENITALLGFTVQEVLSYEWWFNHLHPEDRNHAVASIQETMARGASITEYRMGHKDGSYRWVEDKRRVIRDSSNQPESLVGIWADITERKRAEEVLRKVSGQETGRKKTRVLLDLAVIFGLGALSFAVLYYTDVLEAPLQELVSKLKNNLDDLLVPPVILLIGFLIFSYRRWKDAQSQFGEQANIEDALRKLHDELEKRIQQRTVELSQANETLRTEIAERKRAEGELRWKTAFLEAQVNSSPDGILVVDTKKKRIQQNQRLMELFQVPKEIAEDDGDAKLLQHVTGQMKNPKQFLERVEHLYAQPDEIGRDEIELAKGTILDRYSSPVRDKAGKYYGRIWTFRDITEQRKLEAQFRQAQKMEGIGQLAGGVAHDFNNILAVIQMQSDLLKSSGGLSTDQSEYAQEISITVQRAAALTRQLLLFSRREVFQPRDLDLSDSVTNTTKMLRRILGENVQIQLKLASQPMFIHADAGMMDQVLLNLAVNARDAMPHGGQLVIETSGVEFDEFAASQSPQMRPGSFVRLSVSDSGCGIPPEILPKIFEPFFTTKDVGKGTGLGLATVFGIVQQHQGWINVYSEVNHGTTFRVYLPRLAKNGGEKSAQPALTEMRGGNETILLAEDDPSLRVSVRKALSQLGYRILEAPTGVKALEVWKENRDEVRLLVTDLVMPDGMTGKDLAQRILQENPKLKVIYMSGYSAEVVGKDFPLKEGVNFLTKPFQASKLAQIVRESLDAKI